MRRYAVSSSDESDVEEVNNNGGFDREPGVGVRIKGSEGDVRLNAMADGGREIGGNPSEFDDVEGRSSSAGGTMPSSVWSQSIWTNTVDS
jgi:hypothetical protein